MLHSTQKVLEKISQEVTSGLSLGAGGGWREVFVSLQRGMEFQAFPTGNYMSNNWQRVVGLEVGA